MALVGVLLLVPTWAAAAAPSYLCGPAKARQTGRDATSIALMDRLGTSREATLGRVQAACWAEAPGTERLASFAARASRKARRVGTSATLLTRFGSQQVVVKAFASVAAGAGAPRTCYSVRGKRPGGERMRVVFAEREGERVVEVGRPTRLCLPTGDDDAPELLCHAARPARSSSREKPVAMGVATTFGFAQLRVGAPRELCAPVLADDPPPPPPGVMLRVTPSASTILVGDSVVLEATARFPDGHEEPYTHRVRFVSSDEAVLVGTSVAGAFPLDGVGIGTATVTAVDVENGLSSSGAGNATVTVHWPVERLVITPHESRTRAGSRRNYSVRAYFTGGASLNVTQRVIYASSDPTIVSAPNTPPNRSRVFAHATGTVTISATDPISGISTTDSGDDAILHVSAKLIGIGVASGLGSSSMFPGQVRRWTATGYYDDGTTDNLTQLCLWTSSDPSVAVAPREPGDLSRIEAVAPGYTTITCAAEGLTSYATPLWVLGDLATVQVYGSSSPSDWLLPGRSLRLSARGTYAGGGYHNLTQDVVWTSDDPSIAVATNPPGDRSRIDAVGPGNVVIRATDPTTGISGHTTVVSLGDLVGLAVLANQSEQVVPVDATRLIDVRGIFENGYLNLSHAGRGYTLASSDPGVLEVVGERHVRGVAPGVATLTATDGVVTSPPVSFTVKGSLESITMTPAAATRGIGEWESFTVVGFSPPDFHENLTPRMQYESSDETVAVTAFPWGSSRFDTVGSGTTTITATDPVSGLVATSTLTVLPGAIERVTIEPSSIVRNPLNGFSFTAIGHYPGGATVNVTQVVTWVSLAPDVATAENAAGDRSRVRAKNPGTATIMALHPSGVSSSDSGDDATFTTRPLVGLALTPDAHIGQVGMVERYTLVGTFDDLTTINLTQDGYYWTDDLAVAVAEGEPGDRSAVRMVAPGETTVHGSFADWTAEVPALSGSVVGAFLRVVP